MQKLKFNINGKHYEATVAETSHNVAEVELNGKKYTVEVERAESVALSPGSVTVVNVKAGDAVKAGQTLIIIEAMKMENEVLAPADGTVTAVHVSGGQAVQQGDALLDLA